MRAPSEPFTQPMELQGDTRETVEGWGAALQHRAAADMVNCESTLVDTASIDSVSTLREGCFGGPELVFHHF